MEFVNKTSQRGLKSAILALSVVQMSTNGIAPILGEIAKQFPNVSVTNIQFLMTFPSIFVVIATLISAWLCKYFTKKTILVFGLCLVCLSGILSFMFHENLYILFIWAGLLGIGVGFVAVLATTLISDYFYGEEKSILLGIQTSAANVGSMLMTFLGGVLATIAWNWDYLIYFLALPGIILTICFLPNEQVKDKSINENLSVEKFVLFYCLISAIFMLVYYMGPTNISLLIEEKQIGNSTLAGIAVTILLLGGAIMGIFFGKISTHISKKSIPFGFLVLGSGYYIMWFSHNIIIFLIGCFIVGSSISFVMPQCMLQVASNGVSSVVTLAMALVISCSNLGIFVAPILTNVSKVVMKSTLAEDRILFTAIISFFTSAIFYVVFLYKMRRKKLNSV